MQKLSGKSLFAVVGDIRFYNVQHRYDSVIVNGMLRWQDRLNSVNLPFLLPSTGFFSNYTVSTI